MRLKLTICVYFIFSFIYADTPDYLGEVEGKIKLSANTQERGSISWLIENGTRVKKGDVVGRLDNKRITESLERDQDYLDKLNDDKETLLKDFIESKNKLDLDVRQITLERDLARVDWEIKKLGVYGVPLSRYKASISNAEIDLSKAQTKFNRSETLFKKDLEEKRSYEQAQIDVKIAKINLNIKKIKLSIKKKLFKNEEEKARINLDIKNVILKRTIKGRELNLQGLKFNIKNKEEAIINQIDKVEKRKLSLKNHEIFSPVDGIAKHGKKHGRILKVGARVGQGFAVVYILNINIKKIIIDVHEKFILKYKNGDKAIIKGIDSEATVIGKVFKIGNAPRDKNEKLGPVGRKKGGLSGITVFEVEINFIDLEQSWTPGLKVKVKLP
ncbi:MAG: hypothetical protein COA79_14750 [Planctomycetota bacterium]|nr:MAG: hypothetical protein COA79_14750 [Planctomycetota bacterium]